MWGGLELCSIGGERGMLFHASALQQTACVASTPLLVPTCFTCGSSREIWRVLPTTSDAGNCNTGRGFRITQCSQRACPTAGPRSRHYCPRGV